MSYNCYLILDNSQKKAKTAVSRTMAAYDKLIHAAKVDLPDSSIFDNMVLKIDAEYQTTFAKNHPRSTFKPDPKQHLLLSLTLTTAEVSPLTPNVLYSLKKLVSTLWIETEDAVEYTFDSFIDLVSKGAPDDKAMRHFAGKRLDEIAKLDLQKFYAATPAENTRCLEDLLMSRSPSDYQLAVRRLNAGRQTMMDAVETLVASLDSRRLPSQSTVAERQQTENDAEGHYFLREILDDRMAILEALAALYRIGASNVVEKPEVKAEFESKAGPRLIKFFTIHRSVIERERNFAEDVRRTFPNDAST